MFNLFVSGREESWEGEPWQIELTRCLREYTDEGLTARFGDLSAASVAELKRLPCIFAYEAVCELAPKFGIIRDITKRQREVRVDYELQTVDPFLTAEQLERMSFELDLRKWELNRTHWAIKDVNLPKELHFIGIRLPDWTSEYSRRVDVTKHTFDVALSFPGEVRDLVENIARNLEQRLGPDRYFYDQNYVAQLARPSLDLLLQDIYGQRAKLIVVFLSTNYEEKDWCGIEFRAIREIINKRDHNRIMFIRTDDGPVKGIFQTDGYVDARKFDASQIAGFIEERVNFLFA